LTGFPKATYWLEPFNERHWPAPEGLIKAQDFIVKQLGG